MEALIPAKRNRKKKREYNQEVYENRKSVSSREHVSEIKTLAQDSDAICEKHNLIYCSGTNMLYVPLALHHLTTPSRDYL